MAAVIVVLWFFCLFTLDLYMKMSSLSKKVDVHQDQFHKEIMKRYIDIDEKCGKKLF